jgi:predicted outer membrane repeat protein
MSWPRRIAGTTVAAALTSLAAIAFATTPAAATDATVDTEAELRSAFADGTVTKIILSDDIELDCEAGGADLQRNSAIDLEVDGAGHMIMQTCEALPHRIMTVGGGGSLTLTDVILAGGRLTGVQAGGAVLVSGADLTVVGSALVGNIATSSGGAAFVGGAVLVVDSQLSGNTASGNGGAISASGTVTVISSALTGNTAQLGGGAIFSNGHVSVVGSFFEDNQTLAEDTEGGAILSHQTVEVSNSTLYENGAAGVGGAVSSSQRGRFVNTTVVGNIAGFTGGGLHSAVGIDLVHVTLTGNEAAAGANLDTENVNAFGSVIAQPKSGVNCDLVTMTSTYSFADDDSCDLTDATDRQDSGDPHLGALADNGGPTAGWPSNAMPILTRVPELGSPLIDAISVDDCAVSEDQRGVVRPQAEGCDIGAVEVVHTDVADPTDPDVPGPTDPGATGAPGDPDKDKLPVTGGTLVGILVTALGLAGLGLVLYLAARRQRLTFTA